MKAIKILGTVFVWGLGGSFSLAKEPVAPSGAPETGTFEPLGSQDPLSLFTPEERRAIEQKAEELLKKAREDANPANGEGVVKEEKPLPSPTPSSPTDPRAEESNIEQKKSSEADYYYPQQHQQPADVFTDKPSQQLGQ
jgi:hypothetical protein